MSNSRHIKFMRSCLAGLIATMTFGCVTEPEPIQKSIEEPVRAAPEVEGFLVLGDMPYTDEDMKRYALIKQKIQKYSGQIDFVFHYGDAKPGWMACGEDEMVESVERLYGLLPGRTVYTPGDNDWTDCDRFFKKGESISELKALVQLKALMAQHKVEFEAKGRIKYEPWPDSENFLLTGEHFVFVGIHLVGTNNGWSEVLKDSYEDAVRIAVQRQEKAIEILVHAFAKARAKKRLVIGLHADMFTHKVLEADMLGECEFSKSKIKQYKKRLTKEKIPCSGLLAFKNKLKKLLKANSFPVLLIHGDTNPICFDQPWKTQFPHFWRFNGPGDYQDNADAALIFVNSGNSSNPFEIDGWLSGNPFPGECAYNKE